MGYSLRLPIEGVVMSGVKFVDCKLDVEPAPGLGSEGYAPDTYRARVMRPVDR